MQLTYTIMGAPEATLKSTKMSRVVQDGYNIRRTNYKQQLINQHDDRELLTGAWELQAFFNFEIPRGKSKRHIAYPSIIQLLRFFDEIAHDIIYDDFCIIYELDAYKTYKAKVPSSQFIFTKVY